MMDFRRVFETHDNGERGTNPAQGARNLASNRIEAIDYTVYAQARIYDGADHDAAMAAVEKNAEWAKKNGAR